jgi:hypothetical protein
MIRALYHPAVDPATLTPTGHRRPSSGAAAPADCVSATGRRARCPMCSEAEVGGSLPLLDQGGRDDGHFGMGEPATRSFRLPRLQTARRDQPARAVGANRDSEVERSPPAYSGRGIA